MRIDRARAADAILAALKIRYPKPTTLLRFANPWELLVAVILAAQCTDQRVNQVTPAFFSRWPGPGDLAEASLEEIENVIRPTGFFRNKAKNLLGCARMVRDAHGGVVPAAMDELIALPGVARKTANCVLYAGYGINAGLAVDTHVKRVSFRLGLTENTEPTEIERDLMAIFPREEWGDVNHRFVWFGRDVCKARGPLCEQCELGTICPRLEPEKKAGGKKIKGFANEHESPVKQ